MDAIHLEMPVDYELVEYSQVQDKPSATPFFLNYENIAAKTLGCSIEWQMAFLSRRARISNSMKFCSGREKQGGVEVDLVLGKHRTLS